MSKKKGPGFFSIFEHIPISEKINFTRHLGIIVKAGLPVLESLKIIRSQTVSSLMRKVVDQLMLDVESGRTLSDGLERYNHLFGDFFINIIRVGEASGTLSQNLFYLSDELKKSKELQSKIRSAMVYPAIVLIATLALTSFLTFFVFPKILPVFASLNVQLPVTTQIMIGTLNFFQSYGWQFIVGVAVLLVVMRWAFGKVEVFAYLFDQAIFYVPIVSKLDVSVNLANFTRVLGLLLKSGIKIDEAVKVTTNTFHNRVYHRYFAGANEIIRKGEQLADYLAARPRLFPQLATGIIKIGENTGNLEENLFYLSDYYTEEVDNELSNLTNLLEPFLLLFMGLLVGFVALSIITPIYSITQGLN